MKFPEGDEQMYNVALGDALHVFGPFGIHLDYTVRLKLRLRDRIDAEALKGRPGSGIPIFPCG